MERSLTHGALYYLDREKRLIDVFSRILDAKAAERCRVYGYQLGTLYVKVDSPAWLERLRYKRAEWIRALNIEMGENLIEDIHFRVLPLDSPSPELPVHPEIKKMSDSLAEEPDLDAGAAWDERDD